MIEQDILNTIEQSGWKVVISDVDSSVGNIFKQTVKKLLLYKATEGIAVNQTVRYAVYEDGSCYWWERNPFPEPKAIGFNQELQLALYDFIQVGIIKAGYIERADTINENALVVAVMPDNTYRTFLIERDAQGRLKPASITGSYPINKSSM